MYTTFILGWPHNIDLLLVMGSNAPNILGQEMEDMGIKDQ